MWELRLKNQFGQVEQIQRENCFTHQPVYDDISPNGKGHGYNKANLTVQYTVEWLPERNFEAYDKASLVGSMVNTWELKDEYLTDSLGLALRQMVLREFDPKSDKPQLYMYIKDKNGDEAEAVAEIPADTLPIIRNMVQDDINKKLDHMSDLLAVQKKELADYREFLESVHGMEMYRRWKQEKNN